MALARSGERAAFGALIDRAAPLPAVFATPATHGATEETLLDVTVPPELVPTTVYGGQNHYTIAP